MRTALLTGMLATVSVVVPTGVLAAGSAASAAPAVAARPSGSARPVLYHVPIIGKHLLRVLTFHGGRKNTSDVQSANWAGYVDTGETFQTLSSSWTEPTVNCTSTDLLGLVPEAAYSAFWVGLDGYTSASVEQTGTDSDCTSSGTPSYYAWYEMYPAGSVDLSTTKYPVQPGDHLTGMVTSNVSGSTFYLILKDSTEGWTFFDSLAGHGLARSSAEFIAEAPSECSALSCNELPLANFGTVTFSNAFAADPAGRHGNIETFTNADIQMASDGSVLASTSGLSGGGSDFSVDWANS